MTRACPHSDIIAIKVSDLTVKYDSFVALEGINLEISKGCFVSIIGPNGSGKTTLIRAMLGLNNLTSGKVEIFGKSIWEQKKIVGYVPQRFIFDKTFPITIEEFLKFSLQKGTSSEKIDEKLKEVNMEDQKKKLLGNLSGGQLQRVLIARAILNDPQILFLDEPASGIDIGGEKSFYDLLDYLNLKYKITIVMISHELDVVAKYAHRVICLDRKLVCYGDPKTILDAEMVKRLYGQDVAIHQH
ncbi:MAG: metal ABC transporter ATP-binding protein [Patescibacteria group bacterium]|jgi:ABC-type Mn2+/Zn2+ transport system ATPase subunit